MTLGEADAERAPLLAHQPSATEVPVTNLRVSLSSLVVPKDADAGEQMKFMVIGEDNIGRVLPIAFTASFAIAATSATTLYAYATIICADPAHCQDKEQNSYSGVVALATTIANVFGVVAVAVLRNWAESNPKLGLCFWLICRGVGIGILALGVLLHNIHIAIAGRIFEGMATDNILHYALAAVYVQTSDSSRISRLMGTSLALYMIAMSISPTIVALLPNFFLSFIVAIALLTLSLLYLGLFLPVTTREVGDSEQNSSRAKTNNSSLRRNSFFDPIWYLYRDPLVLLLGIAIFFYSSAQAYLFPAIMLHAAVRLGFTSTENGYIVSIAAGTSAICLLITSYAVPKIRHWFRRTNLEEPEESIQSISSIDNVRGDPRIASRFRDMLYAILSMSVQLVVLPCLVLVSTARELYGLVVLIALGLAAPNFIRSYGVRSATSRHSALASLTIMESTGGLASPIILGVSQSLIGRNGVFIVASSLIGIAILFLIGSFLVERLRNIWSRDESS